MGYVYAFMVPEWMIAVSPSTSRSLVWRIQTPLVAMMWDRSERAVACERFLFAEGRIDDDDYDDDDDDDDGDGNK